ncbi:protein kinase [Sorangium sp. So ce118]
MSIAAGQVLSERYRLIRPVGQGAQASVWVAEHLALSTHVAVKLIDPELAKQEDARERFRREATAAAQLRSAHVVQILDHGIEGEQPFIVMELLEGEDLFERLARRRRLSLQETSKVVTQVARALTRAHGAGIVHRDLKPENFFICANEDDEVVKILDFGIAKVKGQGKRAAQRTTVGTLMGTPHYMSPEQVKGLREVDFRADLWALGVIAYQCVTGELPFDSEGVGDLLIKISVGEIPVPSRVNPELPPTFDAWFARACDREPERRFSSARDLAESLARIADLAADSTGSVSSPRPPPMPPRSAPTRPPAAPPRPATGSTIPKAPPLPRMADTAAGAPASGALERTLSERPADAAASPLSTNPNARTPARLTDRPPAPPRLTDRPPAPPRLTERSPAAPRLTDRPPAPPRLTERSPAPPLVQPGEQPAAASQLGERAPLSERSPLSSRRDERPPAPPRPGGSASQTPLSQAPPLPTRASLSQAPPLPQAPPLSTRAPLSQAPPLPQAPPLSTRASLSQAPPLPQAPPLSTRASLSQAPPLPQAPPLSTRASLSQAPPLPQAPPLSTRAPLSPQPDGAPPAAADDSLEAAPGSQPIPLMGAHRRPADSAPSLLDVDIEEFEEDQIDTDVDEPWVQPSTSTPAALAPQADAALAPQELASPEPQSGAPVAASIPAAQADAAQATTAPSSPPQAPSLPSPSLQAVAPATAGLERDAPPSQGPLEPQRDGVERPPVAAAAAIAVAPSLAPQRASRPLEQPAAPAPVPPARAARSDQSPDHWLKSSSVSGLAHEGALPEPEFDGGSRRRRLVRWGALALVVAAGAVAWQVVRSQRPPRAEPAAESAPEPPATAAEPAPPQEPAPPPGDTAPAASAAPTGQPSASAAATATATATTAPRKRRAPPPKKPRKQPSKVDDLTIEIPDPAPEPADAEPASPSERSPAPPPQEEPTPHAE